MSINRLFIIIVLTMLSVAVGSSQNTGGSKSSYSILDAKYAETQYDYLTIQQVEPFLKPNDLKLLPELAKSKVIVLAITFKGDGKFDLHSVDLDDLEIQWNEKGVTGKAPAVGFHSSEKFILIRQKEIYISMKEPREFFFIVPIGVTKVSLANRQADGDFVVVKPDILLKAAAKKPVSKS